MKAGARTHSTQKEQNLKLSDKLIAGFLIFATLYLTAHIVWALIR